MSSTREHRNEGRLEDAVASIGTTITVCEHLTTVLAAVLPDEFPMPEFNARLLDLRHAQERLGAVIGL